MKYSPAHSTRIATAPSDGVRRAMPMPASGRRYARVAGLAYLIIIVTGIYAEFFVRSALIVRSDAAATATNLMAAQLLFRSGIAAEFVMLLCDVGVALALWVVFRPVSRNIALLAAFLRVVHAAVVAGNLINTYLPLSLLEAGGDASGFTSAQLNSMALTFLDAHGYGYAIGLVFFGAACWALGYLVLRSRWAPPALGYLLMVAGTGYLADSVARTMLINYSEYEMVFGVAVFAPALIAELWFATWLLSKGRSSRAGRQEVVA